MKATIFKTIRRGMIIPLAIIVMAAALDARTKLTTLPERNMIRIDCRNGSNALVEEERTIPLLKGKNQIEFSWINTYIKMGSIQFRVIKSTGLTRVINVNYPPGGSTLYWTVFSKVAGPATFRISYLIGNLKKIISYEAIANYKESHMLFKSYVTLSNMTGEYFKDAKVQISFGDDFTKTFRIGESKKILAAKFKKIPIHKKYIFNTAVDRKDVRHYYLIKNTKRNGLGYFALPRGKVRIYQEDSRGSEAFTGEDWGQYTPLKRNMKLYLGKAKEVKVKRFLYKRNWAYTDKPIKRINRVIKYQVQNFKKKTIPLTILEHPSGQWTVKKIVLKVETGERNKIKEKTINHNSMISWKKKDVKNLEVLFRVPRSTDKKYNIYLHIERVNVW